MNAGPQRHLMISDGLPSQLVDLDPAETQEWLESLDAVVDHAGRDRARYLMLSVLQRAREQQVGDVGGGKEEDELLHAALTRQSSGSFAQLLPFGEAPGHARTAA